VRRKRRLVLQRQHRGSQRRRRALLVALGLFGAALLYRDGIITPLVSGTCRA
jgi:KUP system potassium uptake protein